MKRRRLPGDGMIVCATESDASGFKDGLRGIRLEAVTFTEGQYNNLRRIYDRRHAGALVIGGFDTGMGDISALGEAGTRRGMFRDITTDGLRLMALLSFVLQPGEDPVGFVLRLLQEGGINCGTYLVPEEEGVDSAEDDE